MEYAVGAALALGVAVFAARAGFDRDRAFYPTVLVTIATYYDLFAVAGGSAADLVAEALVSSAFAAVAVVGFRKNLWIVVLALFAHGALDLAHGRLIANPGVPGWWPAFCLSFDWVAAACLGWRLARPPSPAPHLVLAPEGFGRAFAPTEGSGRAGAQVPSANTITAGSPFGTSTVSPRALRKTW